MSDNKSAFIPKKMCVRNTRLLPSNQLLMHPYIVSTRTVSDAKSMLALAQSPTHTFAQRYVLIRYQPGFGDVYLLCPLSCYVDTIRLCPCASSLRQENIWTPTAIWWPLSSVEQRLLAPGVQLHCRHSGRMCVPRRPHLCASRGFGA